MVSLKFAAVICLVYFTVFVNAGKRPTCKTVLARLDEMESLCQGADSDNCDGTDVCTAIKTLEMKLETKLENLFELVENISMSLQPPPVTASSCKELYDNGLRENKDYMLEIDSGKIPVYCHMTSDIGECGGGGWTMVMKIDGSKQTFHYDADLWRNNNEFNLPGGETGFDSQETKLPTYWDTPFSKICLGMKVGQQTKFVVINKQASSLFSLIADGQHRATSLSREKWKSLIGSEGSLQAHCNTQGFNAVGTNSGMAKARIGIIGNQENDCNSCDSRIGFGTGGASDDSNTCGNEATHSPDNGDKHIKAMGFILVQ
ncbi:uncharacterized skeletal organic matrix protein 5-like isoform X1 [Orbicella faveolata]|uniref:uncharacterized skeletal organic matrix protein 5-like isoform X1 n=1 Tax=Orbicella faveolata TaxID=48498 RepID=UPI0009E21B78|nr:uncharacterized skeletal organic matrix protein 5-like isoform X1 [Orbicella faveolata]